MNFDLDDSQLMYRATVERFLGPVDVAARRVLRAANDGYPRGRWGELSGLGLTALAAPEASGGLGGSRIDIAVVAEALGKGISPDPWIENGLLPIALAAAAGDTGLVGQLVAGDRLAAVAFAEPGRRFELDPAGTSADAQARVSGEKTFVPGGMLADLLLVSADTPEGFGLFAVAPDQPGVLRSGYRLVDGSVGASVRLNGAIGRRLAVDQAAFAEAIALATFAAAAEMLGLADRMLADTIDYVKQRRQFDVAIGTFQVIQHRLVDCYTAVEQARSMVWRAAVGGDAGWPGRAVGAKAYVGALAMRVGLEAVQLHGGMGQTDELAIGHALKRVMLLDRLFGDQSHGLRSYARAA